MINRYEPNISESGSVLSLVDKMITVQVIPKVSQVETQNYNI